MTYKSRKIIYQVIFSNLNVISVENLSQYKTERDLHDADAEGRGELHDLRHV